MTLLRFELRQVRAYTLIWGCALAVIIFMMLPVYLGFLLTGADAFPDDFISNNAFYDAIGANIRYLKAPMGIYGFLNSFVLIAGAIGGAHLGMKAFTKEYAQKTADYLLTKQYSRANIFCAKLGAVLICEVFISACYALGSFAAVAMNIPSFSGREFALLTLALLLIQVNFSLIGAFVGVVFPRIRTPLSISSGIAFSLYVLAAFSRKTANPVTKYFTPFIYFDSARIFETGGYNPEYMAVFIAACALLAVGGYLVFSRKDVVI